MQPPQQPTFGNPQFYGDPPQSPAPKPKGNAVWAWVLGIVGLMVALPCGGCVVFVAYLGSVSPETSIYAGNEVPNGFLRTMKDVGALDEDETVLYFYSDALTDIKDGFYFVSDKKVVVYSDQSGGTPLTVIHFDDIKDLDIVRDESFFEDSVITIELRDGRPISFPVSSEMDRDEKFFEAIRSRVTSPDSAST